MPAAWIRCALAALLVTGCTTPESPDAPPAEPTVAAARSDSADVAVAARLVISAARYATLVTLGLDGHPQARVVDPFPAEEDFTIWIATNARTRKVAEIDADSRVTLLYFDREGGAYVTVVGEAERVDDPVLKARYWKSEWAEFYPNGHQGDEYLLLRVTAHRLEVSAEQLGISNDPVTWRPAIVELR